MFVSDVKDQKSLYRLDNIKRVVLILQLLFLVFNLVISTSIEETANSTHMIVYVAIIVGINILLLAYHFYYYYQVDKLLKKEFNNNAKNDIDSTQKMSIAKSLLKYDKYKIITLVVYVIVLVFAGILVGFLSENVVNNSDDDMPLFLAVWMLFSLVLVLGFFIIYFILEFRQRKVLNNNVAQIENLSNKHLNTVGASQKTIKRTKNSMFNRNNQEKMLLAIFPIEKYRLKRKAHIKSSGILGGVAGAIIGVGIVPALANASEDAIGMIMGGLVFVFWAVIGVISIVVVNQYIRLCNEQLLELEQNSQVYMPSINLCKKSVQKNKSQKKSITIFASIISALCIIGIVVGLVAKDNGLSALMAVLGFFAGCIYFIVLMIDSIKFTKMIIAESNAILESIGYLNKDNNNNQSYSNYNNINQNYPQNYDNSGNQKNNDNNYNFPNNYNYTENYNYQNYQQNNTYHNQNNNSGYTYNYSNDNNYTQNNLDSLTNDKTSTQIDIQSNNLNVSIENNDISGKSDKTEN